eukprot:CAMPEP_0115573790 /NCGR_PEP_ID=MMETSP0272-20121206/1188_1 /TAXON_ID=71861 /ORGANISM="Scrippsiella trochoidea, Strain CCMP3099" /LENGTH=519 /DNA_ID=CAMNT_0003008481 /DNA_START=193 /DNA_END=1750 /DNA_ORIENTATION=+
MNPVATSWEFQTDDPEWIVRESVRNHLDLIKDTATSPYALPDRRILEARTPRHAALSLVGEPVLYPRRKEYIAELHKRRISTFLVTNGQFPDELEDLPWVTQLYVSVDAPDQEALKEVGRPIFRDYWERLRRSLEVLREKSPRQRTICRMTVLKGQNMTEEACDGYAELIGLSECDFVEIKGATLAPVWEKPKSGLTFDSMPFHEDVKAFTRSLLRAPWAVAHVDDFEAFADAAIAGTPMEVTDFALETPDWALASDAETASKASSEVGFDPQENRHLHRKARAAEKEARAAEKEARRRSLPKHKMMADVAVLRPEEGHVEEADAAQLLELPHVRSVVAYEPAAAGSERNGVRYVAGDPNLEITYKSDTLSRGQAHEVAEVVGVEKDPMAHDFAQANIQANRLGDRARSVLGDPYTFDLKSLGSFDRVCAFLPFRRDRDGEVIPLSENMALGVQVLNPGGTLTCYNHETQEEFTSEPEEANRSMAVACDGRGFELTWRGKVPRRSIGWNWYRVGMDYRL